MTDMHDTADLVSKALRRAWQLGQTYWQQADSEYQSHWKKADATQATFNQLVEDTRAAILTSNSGTQPTPTTAEQDQINAEAAIRSSYVAWPKDEVLWQTIANGMITPAHMAQAVADGTITPAYIMQPAPSVPEGFSREDLEAVADGLWDGYEKTVNVGNVTGEGDDHLESTTAYAARFIRTMLAVAPLEFELTPSVPDGWKLVPIEPTEKMINEGTCASTLPGPRYIDSACAKQCWTNMLAAAPEAKP